MKPYQHVALFIMMFFSSCTFFQEIYEPRDLLQVAQSLKDKKAPEITVTLPTNFQEVATTYQVIGTVADVGVKMETAGIDKVYASIDNQSFQECRVSGLSWNTVFSNISEGWHTNRYYAADRRGNLSATNRLIVYVQNTIPLLIIKTPANDILTNKESISFEGSADIGNPYQIKKIVFINLNTGTETKAAFMNDEKSWNIYISLAEGTNAYSIRAIATSGRTNVLNWKLVLDKRAPTVIVTSPANGEDVGSVYALTGNISDNLSGLASVRVQIDTNATKQLQISNGAFSTNISLPPDYGTHTNRIIVLDVAHNCATNIVLVERKAIPTITCNYPNGYASSTTAITLSGKVFIDSPFLINIMKVKTNNFNLYMTDSFPGSNWSVSFTLRKTSNFIVINADGNNGISCASTNIIYFDTNAPTVSIAPVPTSTNVSPIFVRGTASDNLRLGAVLIRPFGGSFSAASGTSNWSASIPLTSGANTISAYAVDAGGTVSITNQTGVYFDTVAPTLTVTALPNYTNTTSVQISGTAGDARGIRAVYIRVNSGSWTAASGTTTWTGSVSLTAGTNTIAVYALDNSGNTLTNALSIRKETVAPSIIIFHQPSITNHSPINLSGIAMDSSGIASVHLRVNTESWVTAVGSAPWIYTASLAYNTNTIAVYSVDRAGNSSVTNSIQIFYYPPLTVTFNSSGGTAIASTNVNYNTSVKTPSAPTRTGNGFCGWYLNTNTASVWNFVSNKVVSNISLTALWLSNAYYTDNGTTITLKKYFGSILNIVLPVTVNGKTIVSIATNAFLGFSSTTNIVLSAGVTNIGNSAFYGCMELQSIILPSGLIRIGSYAFFNCTKLRNVNLPSTLTYLGYSAFFLSTNIRTITLSPSLTYFGSSVFTRCKSLTNIVFPNGLTVLGDSAFRECAKLRNACLNSGLTTISNYAFFECIELTNVTFPSSLKTIGNSAFYGCSNLTRITLPVSLISISTNAFLFCRRLSNITILATNPPTLGIDALYGTTALQTIRVPAASTNAYKTASGWSAYAAKIVAIP